MGLFGIFSFVEMEFRRKVVLTCKSCDKDDEVADTATFVKFETEQCGPGGEAEGFLLVGIL